MTSALDSIRRRVSSKQRPFPPALTWLTAVLTLLVLAGARSLAQDVTGTFVSIAVPGASFTAARAITADGRIVGFFNDARGQHGFLLADGSFTTIDVPVPGARSTTALGINSRGDIVGGWVDSAGVQHGYLLPAYGSFTTIDVPDAVRTFARGVNAAGDIVGFYDTTDKRHGFLLSRAGVLSSIDLPGTLGPIPNGTWATWINERGDIVGPFFDGAIHGYFMSDGVVTQLDAPFPGTIYTQAYGLNTQGDIVGYYAVGSRLVAFRRDRHGDYTSLDAPTATPASATMAFGINAPGDIVGQYTHVGVTRGFVMYRTQTP